MRELIVRFLQSSRIDPVYFVTGVFDVISFFMWIGLKRGVSVTRRSLYRAMIFVAFVLTAACLSKYFEIIKDWKDLRAALGIVFRFSL